MKKLSKSKIKKIAQLQKNAKKEINKAWGLYHKMKSDIGTEQAKELTHYTISKIWEKYRDIKYPVTHKSKFQGLKFDSKLTTTGTKQETYKIISNKKLDSHLNKIFSNKKIRYVLVTFKIKTSEGLIQYVSDSFTPERYEILKDSGADIFEEVMTKMSFVQKYDGYELLNSYIRIIYENFKTTSKADTKKTRKVKA